MLNDFALVLCVYSVAAAAAATALCAAIRIVEFCMASLFDTLFSTDAEKGTLSNLRLAILFVFSPQKKKKKMYKI